MREQGPAVTVRFENTGCALVDLAADPDCGESRLRVSVETWWCACFSKMFLVSVVQTLYLPS
jgi:hypothetical protein